MQNLRWIVTAALAAYACHLAVLHTTPVDLALPLLGLVVTFLAWTAYPSVMLAVPLLIVVERAFAEEAVRLLALGAVMALAFGLALSLPAEKRNPGGSLKSAVPLVIILLLLSRWIPLEQVLPARDMFLLAVAVATAIALGRTPFAIAVAVIAAFVTPAVPLRTMLLPLAVLLVAIVARLFGMPRLHLRWPSTIVLMTVVLFFPWSGILARALPYFFRPAPAVAEREVVGHALVRGQSVFYDVPADAKVIVLSGANVDHLRRGARLGTIEPGGIPVRIGEASDWGYLRREHFYAARNPLPRDAAGTIRGYGYGAWLDGAGRVALPRGARRIRVTADARLPADASLQVEGFE